MNNTFCSLAWLGITTDPDGSIKPCAVSTDKITKDDGSDFNLGIDSLQDIYNSKAYVSIREKMLKGETVTGCDVCYNNEKYGRESRRLINNAIFKDEDYSKTVVDLNIKHFDLRLSNKCNLKCRMCSPMNSSLIEEEYLENKDTLDSFYFKSNSQLADWADTQTFDDNFNSQINNVHTLYMTGGEPTVIKKNYDILQRLIDSGRSKDITVMINTNLVSYNPKFYNLMKQFGNVIVQISIDAIDGLATYIRYPSDFKTIDKNLRELLALEGNISIKATCAIQILNLNKLDKLFDYFESFNRSAGRQVIDIRPIFVQHPQRSDFIYLPTAYKIACFRKVFIWMMNDCKYQSPQFKDSINALKKKCYETVNPENHLIDFIKFNNELDRIRNVSLRDYNTELYQVLNA